MSHILLTVHKQNSYVGENADATQVEVKLGRIQMCLGT